MAAALHSPQGIENCTNTVCTSDSHKAVKVAGSDIHKGTRGRDYTRRGPKVSSVDSRIANAEVGVRVDQAAGRGIIGRRGSHSSLKAEIEDTAYVFEIDHLITAIYSCCDNPSGIAVETVHPATVQTWLFHNGNASNRRLVHQKVLGSSDCLFLIHKRRFKVKDGHIAIKARGNYGRVAEPVKVR